MNETVLNSIIKLFALITLYDKESDVFLSKGFVKLFLKRQFNETVQAEQMENYDSCMVRYKSETATQNDYEETLLSLCSRIGPKITQNQRLIILVNVLQYLKHNMAFSDVDPLKEPESYHISFKIARTFHFSEDEYFTLKGFLGDQLAGIPNKEQLLISCPESGFGYSGIKHHVLNQLQGQLVFLYLPETFTLLFRYKGETELSYHGKTVYSDLTYIFEPGSYIAINDELSIYYNEVILNFQKIQQKLRLDAAEISFHFPNSLNGIEPFSFSARSGELVGIMGVSGSGKSTLLNLLNGNLPLKKGSIYINGHSVHEPGENLNGVIGYVPQDDLIIEELTVFENLYYNARLCFGNLSGQELIQKVNQELKALDIYEVKDLPAGNPLNKFISGGQRKRLNIALETIRKPAVLYIDEPTSGLSSSDSDKMVSLLKQLTLSGKLLFINIHQPSSDVFKKLDKLLVLDKGGRPVYYGNPVDALIYFRENTQQIDLIEGQCPTCKTVHPDDILELIELKKVDETGQESSERKHSPDFWYQKFRNELNIPLTKKPEVSELPEISFAPPGSWAQFLTYLKRNVLIKANDRQFIAISLLITPLLSLILSVFVKSYPIIDGIRGAYSFAENGNIPSFLFMSVVVSIFIGLSMSAQDIIKDRTILKREQFLNLSWASYFNSKVVVLFVLSAIQSISFLLIANPILKISGMFLSFFLVLFSLSLLSNLMGLFLSATVKSVVAIYILIPLLLIPQLLLSGVIIPFDKINYRLASQQYVPFVADLMPSRWGYEALMVHQFTHNNYQKWFFDVDRDLSNVSFYTNYTIPKLQLMINQMQNQEISVFGDLDKKQLILYNELKQLEKEFQLDLSTTLQSMPAETQNTLALNEVEFMLTRLKSGLNKRTHELNMLRDSLVTAHPDIKASRSKYNNAKVEEVVRNTLSFERIVLDKQRFVRKYEPIYQLADSETGRAHFYAPEKTLGSFQIPTLYFNLLMLWLMILCLYLFLVLKLHEKLFGLNQKLTKSKSGLF
jgi:ABC-type multidrug transport system ATPase subunit/ABC-type multidrug transport system permease subunit